MLNQYDGHRVYIDGEYPAIYLHGKNVHVHKLEWTKYHGEIPKGNVIHHKDENKLNWDISNLELLSRKDHLEHHRKSHRRGHLKGDNSPHRKLSKAEVDYIRHTYVRYDRDYGGRALAVRFGVTEACISEIIHNINWKG